MARLQWTGPGSYEAESLHTPESRERDARLVGHEPKGQNMTDTSKEAVDEAAVRVKPLVWGHHFVGEIASNGIGSYIINTRGVRPRWLKWPNGRGPERETVDEMKAAAQADHEARIRSQIEMAPVTLQQAAMVILADNDEVADFAIQVMRNNRIQDGKRIGYQPAIIKALRALAEQEEGHD